MAKEKRGSKIRNYRHDEKRKTIHRNGELRVGNR